MMSWASRRISYLYLSATLLQLLQPGIHPRRRWQLATSPVRQCHWVDDTAMAVAGHKCVPSHIPSSPPVGGGGGTFWHSLPFLDMHASWRLRRDPWRLRGRKSHGWEVRVGMEVLEGWLSG